MDQPPLRVLVTAGPTQEPLDSVRYLANRSSGRMGEAIADAAVSRGCAVTLLLGSVQRAVGSRWESALRFRTTADLEALLKEHMPEHDCLFMAAAVADHRPTNCDPGKLRRDASNLRIELEPTPDLLAGVSARRRGNQFLVGFALEPEAELDRSAREKLRRKGVDAIVANALETMDSPVVRGRVYLADGSVLAPADRDAIPKERFALWLMESLLPLARANRGVA